MTGSLIDLFGVGSRELVSFTGGGGKTTLLLGLGRELAGRGDRVVLTTTTKLGLDQASDTSVCWTDDTAAIGLALEEARQVFVLSERDDHKVRGFDPQDVSRIYEHVSPAHVLVEADGSRGRPLKAPDPHEPVVPEATTLAVVVLGIDAIGRPIAEGAHRPARVAALTGKGVDDVIDPETAAAVISNPDGGLKGIPESCRVVVAVTKVEERSIMIANRLVTLLADHKRIERVVSVPFRS
ncbi:MAG: selenium cofactor biosynthesis protein YqeC [Acidimicrobiia bacterium]